MKERSDGPECHPIARFDRQRRRRCSRGCCRWLSLRRHFITASSSPRCQLHLTFSVGCVSDVHAWRNESRRDLAAILPQSRQVACGSRSEPPSAVVDLTPQSVLGLTGPTLRLKVGSGVQSRA